MMEDGLNFSLPLFPRTPEQAEKMKIPILASIDPSITAPLKHDETDTFFEQHENISPEKIVFLIEGSNRAKNLMNRIISILSSHDEIHNFALARFTDKISFLTCSGREIVCNLNEEPIDLHNSIFHEKMMNFSSFSSTPLGDSVNVFGALNFARVIIGGHGRIFLFLSSTPTGFMPIPVHLDPQHFNGFSPNFSTDFARLSDQLSSHFICTNAMLLPESVECDSFLFSKIAEKTNGIIDFVSEGERPFLDERINTFLESYAVEIEFNFPPQFQIYGRKVGREVIHSNVMKTSLIRLKYIEMGNKFLHFSTKITFIRGNVKVERYNYKEVEFSDNLYAVYDLADSEILLKYLSSILFQSSDYTITSFLAPIVSSYRKFIQDPGTPPSSEMLPKGLAYLPYYCLSLLRSPPFSYGVGPGYRQYLRMKVDFISPRSIVLAVVPILKEIDSEESIPLSLSAIQNGKIYVMTSGFIGHWFYVNEGAPKREDLFIYDSKGVPTSLVCQCPTKYRIFYHGKGAERFFIDSLVEENSLRVPSYQKFLKMLGEESSKL